MATVKPFKAIRPNEAVADQVAALPYDVYSRAEAYEAVKGHPLSFLNIDRPETQFAPDIDMYADYVYDKAHDMLAAQIADGTYVQDDTPCYYIYELVMDGRHQVGLAACSSVDEYQNGTIKKHENTRADKEADRIHHVDTVNAQTGPIFLAYRAVPEISALIASIMSSQAPMNDFVSEDGIAHRVWKVSDAATVATIEKLFAEKVPCTYIADGHHRAASAVRVAERRRKANPNYDGTEEFNSFLSVLFADETLMIMPYNRVVKDLNGMSSEEFMAKVAECFTIETVGKTAVSPCAKNTYGMYLDDCWYKLTLKPELSNDDAVEGLDVSLLQNYLLAPILGIADPKTDKRIDFVGGIRGTAELERRCHADGKVAFSMYATSIAELFGVADANKLMPPKSTWFEPKLRSGLLIHQLDK